MSHFGESKFNKKTLTIGRLFSIHILCQEMYPLMLKTQLQRGGKKTVSYLVCQTVCVFCIDTMFSSQPNMVVLPNLTWLSLKQAGTMAHDCFLLRHTDWYYV